MFSFGSSSGFREVWQQRLLMHSRQDNAGSVRRPCKKPELTTVCVALPAMANEGGAARPHKRIVDRIAVHSFYSMFAHICQCSTPTTQNALHVFQDTQCLSEAADAQGRYAIATAPAECWSHCLKSMCGSPTHEAAVCLAEKEDGLLKTCHALAVWLMPSRIPKSDQYGVIAP